jgi:ATP-binding cassette subfamily F protein 3
MIAITGLSVHFTGEYLFDNISLAVSARDRIGLVGKNGAGKSTLLKILAGEIVAEKGHVVTPNLYTIGYLPQDIASNFTKSVHEEALAAFSEVLTMEHRIAEISHELTIRTDYESDAYSALLEEMTELNDRFINEGGMTIEAEAQKILQGLGFLEHEMEKPASQFSGGWQMRIELAKLLLKKPNCILLDEPTNHLDIESIRWLEKFLADYDGCVLLVSHDRAFLDAVTNRTIEIRNAALEDYPASYTRYTVMREERMALQKSAYDNQQKEIKKQEQFIERFRSKANLATRVQSRIKQLDKIERIELEEDDISAIRLRFPPVPRSGQTVVETHNLEKAYNDKRIFSNINFALERGERVAFVGKNGEGKTTLAKILAKTEEQTSGEVKIGHNVQIGYYAQHQAESLDGNATVFEIIDRAATGEMRTKIRSLLGAFLFSGDSVEKKVKVLSGGEKSRLALAKLMLEPVNLLILDEPTNHLDMRSKDALKDALAQYEGALIVVSHDREFLTGLTEKVVEFRGGLLREFVGDVQEFIRQRDIESLRELERKTVVQQSSTKPKTVQSEQKAPQVKDKKQNVKKLSEIEKSIEAIEKSIVELEQQLSLPEIYSQPTKTKELQQRHSDEKNTLESLYAQWEELSKEH